MPEYEIDFSNVGAKTPFEANNELHFRCRAQRAIEYEANHSYPAAFLGGEMSGEDAVVNAIARLELGGTSNAVIPLGPNIPGVLEFGTETKLVPNIELVNDVLHRTWVRAKVGTSADDIVIVRTGEWDTVLKGLVVILYRHRAKLRPDVYAHVLHSLMNQRGARPRDADRVDLGGVVGVPLFYLAGQPYETENHVLLIESSRYLTNQLLYLEGSEAGAWLAEFDNEANGMNEWMLKHLQVFLQHDFWEYNSKPYQRYSMAALQNLYDFAWDERVKRAARMVLDYVSAKMAVSSNGLRRAVPFRRLASEAGETRLFSGVVDAQTSRFIMLSGLTTRLGDVQPPFHAASYSSDQLLLAAVTTYRAPELVLDIMMNKSHNRYYQQFHHGDHPPVPVPIEAERMLLAMGAVPRKIPGGIEIYASSDEFLLSAGGVWLPSGNLDYDEINGYRDCANPISTTLMPGRFGPDRADFIQIHGSLLPRYRINTGLIPGFGCGSNVVIPPSYTANQQCVVRSGNWTFINASDSCPDPHNKLGFHVAVYIEPQSSYFFLMCFNFGFFEVVPSASLEFKDFVNVVLQKNGHRKFSWQDTNEYETVDGRHVHFIPGVIVDKYQWGILRVDNQEFDTNIHNWPLARGDIMNSDGHTGYVTVDNPYLKERLVLDMRDPMIPRRYQIRLDAPRHTAGALVSRDMYRLDAFWVGPDGEIGTTNWDQYVNQATWALPVPLTAPSHARLNSAVVAVARTSENLDLFWIGPDNAICSNWRSANANSNEWSLPFNIPGLDQYDVAGYRSGLAAVSRVHDQLDLFWIAADGAVRTQWWNGSFPGGAWDRHGAFAITTDNAARGNSPLSAIARGPGQLDVFWVAPDGAICMQWWIEGAPDGNWDQHGVFTIAPRGSAGRDTSLTAVAKRPGHVDLFWVGGDGAVWTHWWDSDAVDGRWDQHPPFPLTPPNSVGTGSGLAATARIPTQVDAFWITPGGAIASTYWEDRNPQREWTRPFTLTRNQIAQTDSPLYAFAREPEHLDLTWVGPDNALWTHWWDARGDGGGWDRHEPFPVTRPNAVNPPMR